jgi:hypothetical protein
LCDGEFVGGKGDAIWRVDADVVVENADEEGRLDVDRMGMEIELVNDGVEEADGVLVGDDGRGDVLEEHADLLTPVDDQRSFVPLIQLPPEYPQASAAPSTPPPYPPLPTRRYPRSSSAPSRQPLPTSPTPRLPSPASTTSLRLPRGMRTARH